LWCNSWEQLRNVGIDGTSDSVNVSQHRTAPIARWRFTNFVHWMFKPVEGRGVNLKRHSRFRNIPHQSGE